MTQEIEREKQTEKENKNQEAGMQCAQLTGADIRDRRSELDPNLVIAPYHEKDAKGCGYNLTATEFVYSLRKKALLPIHKSGRGETYAVVPSHDTVLLLTREYIKLSGSLAGIFCSRVQLVSSGLGHISTTLDPGWNGMLLFSINNPMKKKIKLILSEPSDGEPAYKGIATMILHPVNVKNGGDKLVDPSLDNPAMRLDVLKRLVSEPKRLVANKRYQNLRRLISELEHFEPASNTKTERLNGIKKLLLDLEREINSYMSVEEIRGSLTALKRADYESFETLRAKIDVLCKTDLSKVGEPEGRKNIRAQLLQGVEAGYRECDYQLLCEHVDQIHKLIHSRVPHVWKHHTLKRLLGFLRDHWRMWLVYTAAIIVMAILYQSRESLFQGAAVIIPATATIAPPFIAYLLDRSGPPEEGD